MVSFHAIIIACHLVVSSVTCVLSKSPDNPFLTEQTCETELKSTLSNILLEKDFMDNIADKLLAGKCYARAPDWNPTDPGITEKLFEDLTGTHIEEPKEERASFHD